MATTFDVIFLGVQSEIDQTEGDNTSENAGSLVGLSFGTLAEPLAAAIQTMSLVSSATGNTVLYDTNNNLGGDTFQIDGGAVQTFDGVGGFTVVLTYLDGSDSAPIDVTIFQDTAGRTYLAPALSQTATQDALEFKAIASLEITAVDGAAGDMSNDRDPATFLDDAIVQGTTGDDIMGSGYTDADGDSIGGSADSIFGDAGNDSIDGSGGNDTIFGGAGNDTLFGGADDDYLDASEGIDSAYGGSGNDRILYRGGGTGSTIEGGDGNDRIEKTFTTEPNNANDLVDGGGGVDTYVLDSANGTFGTDWAVNLAAEQLQFSGNNRGTLLNFENVEIIGYGSSVIGNAGDNRISASGEFDNSLEGGAGNDSVFGGGGNDTIFGDAGNDTLQGDGGNDTIFGGDGADTFFVGAGAGDDIITGGEGGIDNDILIVEAGSVITYGGLTNEAGSVALASGGTTTFFEIENIRFEGAVDGTAGADTIGPGFVDTDGDSIDGADGDDDLVYGYAGNDTITPGAGDDTVYGGDGRDRFIDGAGNDTFYGGADSNVYITGAGNDTYYGGDDQDIVLLSDGFGNDVLFGGLSAFGDSLNAFDLTAAASIIYTTATGGTLTSGGFTATFDGFEVFEAALGVGGTIDASLSGEGVLYYDYGGATTATGSAFDDRIWAFGADPFSINDRSYYGGAGNDDLDSANGNDILDGGTGDDTIVARGGNDTITGGQGDDTIFGGDGNDTIIGGAGDDVLLGDDGSADLLVYGGSFKDYTYAISGAGELLVTEIASGEVDTASGFERIQFSEGIFDLVVGTNGNDGVIAPGTNPAFFVLGDGDNNALGGPDADVYFGGDGIDSFGTDGGADTVYSGGGNDAFGGGDGDDELYAGSGDDAFGGNVGNDTLYGGSGNDGMGGDSGNDTLFGGDGDDSMGGGTDDDTVFGGSGNDAMGGDSGNDTLVGGAGNDTLTLGVGDDTAVFDRFGGDDIVTDFDTGDGDGDGFYNDQLDVSALRNLDGDPVTNRDVVVSDNGAGFARLTFPEGETVTLQGVPVAEMSSRAQLFAAGIPCFTAGTLILTPHGSIPVEQLKPGDRVMTRDNGLQPIVWVGQRRLGRKDLLANPKLRPIYVAADTFRNEQPVMFSPQHGLLLHQKDGGGDETFVRARHLARLNGGRVRVAHGVSSVTYVHLMFETHQVIMSAGLWTESFYPGPQAMNALRQPEMDELLTLFPCLQDSDGYGGQARPFARYSMLAPHIRALDPVLG